MSLRATDDTGDPQSETLGIPGASPGHPDLASEVTQRLEMSSHRVASGRSTEEFSAELTGPPPRKSPSQREPTSVTPAERTHRVPPPTQMEERPETEAPMQHRRVERRVSSSTEQTKMGCEEAELSGGDVEPTAESSGSVEDSAVAGVSDLAEAASAPAREALGGVGEVEA
ncbi:unnamed protein product [Phytophthora fragariaefolia]|uniref:Unnamed protein product n=1 Tax=Phytophthora fragariaefolia TaxID=1490495 RepID=A0A9W6XG71_9STRA|nr:unnamed protein product [Phytophthora fragariaefolia]